MNNTAVAYDAFSTLCTIGWLFTIGYLDQSFWKGLLGIIIWPYYIGCWFRKNPPAAK